VNPRKQINKLIKIYDTMHKILEIDGVQRVIIYKIHNGGGVIKPTGDLYSSILYEDYVKPFKSKKELSQRIVMDVDSLKIIRSAMESKRYLVRTSDLPEGNTVKEVYIGDDVKSSIIYFLRQDKKSAFFCSVATSKSDREWMTSPKEYVQVDALVNIIRQNIK
jgi:hypothetical protein